MNLSFFKSPKGLLALGILIIALIAIPITVYLTGQRQNLKQSAQELPCVSPTPLPTNISGSVWIYGFPPHLTANSPGDPTKRAELKINRTVWTDPIDSYLPLYPPYTDELSFGADSTAGDGSGVEIGSGAQWPFQNINLNVVYHLWSHYTSEQGGIAYTDGQSKFLFDRGIQGTYSGPANYQDTWGNYKIITYPGVASSGPPGSIFELGSFMITGISTPTPSLTGLPSGCPAPTPTNTPTPTNIITPIITPLLTPTDTPIPTDTLIPTPTDTPVPDLTNVPTDTPFDTQVPTPTDTQVPTPTDTPVPTDIIVATDTPQPGVTVTLTSTPTDTIIPSTTPIDLTITNSQAPTIFPTATITLPATGPTGIVSLGVIGLVITLIGALLIFAL